MISSAIVRILTHAERILIYRDLSWDLSCQLGKVQLASHETIELRSKNIKDIHSMNYLLDQLANERVGAGSDSTKCLVIFV
jgi:hypothetical protein